MYKSQQDAAGPTLRHPKPVPPPYPLPSSPPLPDAESASSNSSQYARPSGEYQRFASPPNPAAAHNNAVGDYHKSGGGVGRASGEYYRSGAGGGAFYRGSGGGSASKADAPNVYIPAQYSSQPGVGAPPPSQAGWGPGVVGSGGGFAPGMGAQFGVNDATAMMGVQFGQSAMRAGHDYVERNISRYLPVSHLKHSFNVSNSYVITKLRTVVFPWRHKPWSRLVKRSEVSGQAEGYRPPREDVNAPDAYIPVMATITYILLSGVVAGSKGQFDPQLLSYSATKAFGILALEFLAIKLGCYLLNIAGEGAVIDLLAYCGYKFVGIVISLLTSLFGVRRSIAWVIFLYVFCANAFFLLRSLRYFILPDASTAFGAASTSTVNSSQKARRIQFLFAIAVSQLGSMWILSMV